MKRFFSPTKKEVTMMKTPSILTIALISLASVFFFSSAFASGGSHTLVLDPMAKHPDASGTAYIAGDHINVQARGLKPDAVYTVWFVKMKPKKSETGAGTAPFMFRTDAWGNGSYSAPLQHSPYGKWSMVMVVQHPNGDPKDMKSMVGALKASL
jgi:hypothetical protein